VPREADSGVEGEVVRTYVDFKAALDAGDTTSALRVAAKLPEQDGAIVRAWNCLRNPDFYREMGYDLDATVAAGVAALREKYKL
jgi:hypothetical protein